MRQERLVIFCSNIDVDLAAIRAEVGPVLERLDLSQATLKPISAPECLHDAGWMTIALRSARPEGLSTLASHLGEVTHAFARALKNEAVALHVDGKTAKARACLHGEGGFPRLLEGEAYHVIRQVAAWLETDAHQLSAFFSATPRNQVALEGPIDLSVVEAPDESLREKDEEDRYVEARLKVAREWMDRYLGRRK